MQFICETDDLAAVFGDDKKLLVVIGTSIRKLSQQLPRLKEENVDVVVPKEDKKFVPLRADEINVSAIRDTSGSNDVNIRGVKVYISSQFNNYVVVSYLGSSISR